MEENEEMVPRMEALLIATEEMKHSIAMMERLVLMEGHSKLRVTLVGLIANTHTLEGVIQELAVQRTEIEKLKAGRN